MSRTALLLLALGVGLAACRTPVREAVKAEPAPADTAQAGTVRHDTTMIDSPLPGSPR